MIRLEDAVTDLLIKDLSLIQVNMSHNPGISVPEQQHDQAEGCCHTFVDKGFEFDTGKYVT